MVAVIPMPKHLTGLNPFERCSCLAFVMSVCMIVTLFVSLHIRTLSFHKLPHTFIDARHFQPTLFPMSIRKYAFKRCTRCDAYIEIAIPNVPTTTLPVYAITGRCLDCGFGLCWLVFVSKVPSTPTQAKTASVEKIRGAPQLKVVVRPLFSTFLGCNGVHGGVLLSDAADELFLRARFRSGNVLIESPDGPAQY